MISLDTSRLPEPVALKTFLEDLYKPSLVRRAFRKKGVKVNGKRIGEDTLLNPGDTVTLHISMEEPEWVPEILLDRGELVIINKPPGVVVQQNEKLSFDESLEGKVYRYFKSLGREAFLVHRLDRDTSGCLLFACNGETLSELKDLSGTDREEKVYCTLVKGVLPRDTGSITNKLPGRDGQPVPSRTEYTVTERFPVAGVSLLDAVIRTGRLHQIRLHFAGLGYPVAGDGDHGDFKFNRELAGRYGLKRQFLHARKLSFDFRGETVTAEAPLPEDLARVLKNIRG